MAEAVGVDPFRDVCLNGQLGEQGAEVRLGQAFASVKSRTGDWPAAVIAVLGGPDLQPGFDECRWLLGSIAHCAPFHALASQDVNGAARRDRHRGP